MQNEYEPKKELVLQACTHTQLAAAYGISRKVLRTWLKDHQKLIGPRKGYYYNLEQVLTIIELIGLPPNPIGKG